MAGNEKLLHAAGLTIPDAIRPELDGCLAQGCTLILTAVDGTFAGFLALSDTIRPESAQTIAQLARLGVQPVLLTGDHQSAAEAIGGQLGIPEIHADCLPEDKLRYLEGCQDGGQKVCMIGDGINDAPALKKANVGIAMGAEG